MANLSNPIISVRLVLSSGAEIVLGLGEHVLGRATECEVCVPDPLASRRHAVVAVTPESVTIRDLGSRNGVVVNGDEIERFRALCEGDLITLGSQAVTVRSICRAGLTQRPVKGSPLAKIAVTKRAVPREEALADMATVTTTLGDTSKRLDRPAAAFQLIGEAAALAIATGRAGRAEKILDAPLTEVLATLRTGIEVEDEVIAFAISQALLLAELTHDKRWIDYVHDLHDLKRRPLPLEIADRLSMIVTR
jgi:pSer/pThr/pTyr-binding forkhead associated (FHA) protein